MPVSNHGAGMTLLESGGTTKGIQKGMTGMKSNVLHNISTASQATAHNKGNGQTIDKKSRFKDTPQS